MNLSIESGAKNYDTDALYRNALMPAPRNAERPEPRPGVAPESVSFGHVARVAVVHELASLPVESLVEPQIVEIGIAPELARVVA